MATNNFLEFFEEYKRKFTQKEYYKSLLKKLETFDKNDIVDSSLEIQSEIKFKETSHNSSYLFSLLDYSKKVDEYFENQRNKLLNYSLALGGFSSTYITTMLAGLEKNIISREFFNTQYAFFIILIGCVITWAIYILSFSPKHPHRKRSYSPFFYKYNVCGQFSHISFNFLPTNKKKEEEVIKAYSLDLASFITKNKSSLMIIVLIVKQY